MRVSPLGEVKLQRDVCDKNEWMNEWLDPRQVTECDTVWQIPFPVLGVFFSPPLWSFQLEAGFQQKKVIKTDTDFGGSHLIK